VNPATNLIFSFKSRIEQWVAYAANSRPALVAVATVADRH